MLIDLGILKDGGVMLVCSEALPDIVKRVEFYREQKLFNLVYYDDAESSDLMHREIPKEALSQVEQSPDMIIYSLFPDHDPIGYKVPLIQVGSSFL